MPGSLSIFNFDTNTRETISRAEANDAREILGVQLSPDGSWTAQQSCLKLMMDDFTGRLKTSQLSKSETKNAITACYGKR